MLSLASPWLMLGLLGLALPIAAHLIYAHQSERVLFPSIHLITPTRTPQSRRKSVSNLLLLFIRILTILFLTLGAAGLQWVEPESEITASETIILIDQSASMNTSDKQSLVADLLEALVRKQEGKTGFITFGKQPNVLLPLTRDSKEILAAIENVKAGLEEGRPQSAIDTAVQLFGSQSAEKHLHIISDYQAVNWQSINHQLGEASISFTLHEINDEHRNNQTILTAAHSELSQKSQRISASLTSVADETQQRLLQLQVGDSVFEKTVAIHPDRPNQVFFEIPQTFSGAATLRFVEQDDYEADDTYHFWITRPLPSKVAFVTPGSDAEISREEPKFLASALLSQAENQWRRFEMVDSLAGKGRKLHPDFVDILMIAGFPKNLSPAIANGLRQYMQEGGIVLATTGNGMAETLKQLEDMKILSARFLGAGSKTRLDMKPFRISPLRKES
ncbi:MAG: BatA and WFA domain-containing protein, partial [Gammaproteobacteria bacterium]|nr:BatA and WFA domain-containing protein [Gammaproteobacteria bacterium]